MLSIKDIDELKYIENDFKKACSIIFNSGYNKYKYDLRDLNLELKELFKIIQNNIKLKEDVLIYITQEISQYFKEELYDYSDNYKFYDTNESKPFKITSSWKIDKNILELVHILKTFNFKKNKLIIYGY